MLSILNIMKAVCLLLLLPPIQSQAPDEVATTDSSTPNPIAAATTPKPPPTFRIVAPQVICPPRSGTNTSAPAADLPKQITISMQTPGGQRLTYRVQLFFEVLGGFRGQQHALRLWESVRRLERRVNGRDRSLISLKNQINVNNTELTSGVYYIFRIVGIDADGAESEPRNYTVTFSDGSIKRTNPDGSIIPDDVSFLLRGAPSTYADHEYVVEAHPFFCQPNNDFRIAWTVPQLSAADQRYTRHPGNVLRLPAYALRAGGVYTVESRLLRANDSHVIVYQSVQVTVLRRGFDVKLVPDRITIGVGSPAMLRVRFIDADRTGQRPQVVWTCQQQQQQSTAADDDGNTATTGEVCPQFEAADGYEQITEFASQGEFVVRADVVSADGKVIASRQALVRVDKDVIVRPRLQLVPLRAVAAGERLQIDGVVEHLVPHCYCEWTVAKESGFAYFNESILPNGLGNLSVFDMEGNFLGELIDFENATVTRDITLTVPARDESADWPGLTGDVRYKFRLSSTCPVPISDSDLDALPAERPNITSYTDIVIKTNAAPVGHSLEVVPLRGFALRTMFKFTTGTATDKPSDYPLRYSFQFVVDVAGMAGALTIGVGDLYENTVSESVLPYASGSIRSEYEVCDSRGACATTRGPNVTVARPSAADDDVPAIGEQIAAAMERMEYDGAFRMATITAVSLRNADAEGDSKLQEFRTMMKSVIAVQIERIERILAEPDEEVVYLPTAEIVNFVNQARRTLALMSNEVDENGGDDAADDGPMLQRLLQLFGQVDWKDNDGDDNDGGNVQTMQMQRMMRIKPLRHKRALDNVRKTSQVDSINTQLDIVKALLANRNESVRQQAKQNLTRAVHEFMMGLCRKESFAPKSFDKKFVKFEVRDGSGLHIGTVNHSVPFSADARKVPGATVNFNNQLYTVRSHPPAGGRYCVAKAWYASDFVQLDDERPVPREIFEIVIVALGTNGGDTTQPLRRTMVDLVNYMNVSSFDAWLPFYVAEEAGRLHCEVWWQQRWRRELCAAAAAVRGQFVRCQCQRLGFVRLALDREMIAKTEEEPIVVAHASAVTAKPDQSVIANGTESVTELVTMSAVSETTTQVATVQPITVASTIIAPPETTNQVVTVQHITVASTIIAPPPTTTAQPADTLITVNGSKTVINETTTRSPISETTTALVTIMPEVTTKVNDVSSTTTAISSTKPTVIDATDNSAAKPTVTVISDDVVTHHPLNVTAADARKTADYTEPQSGSMGYALAGGAVLLGSILIGGLYLYHFRRSSGMRPEVGGNSSAMAVITNELREPTPAVRYARFHDEQTMRGDNIETVFNGR